MDELVRYFTNNITGDKIWIGFLFLAIYYILKKEPFKVVTHFSERRDKDYELAKSLLELNKLSQQSADMLIEHLEKHAFRKYHKINADTEMRDALITFHTKHQKEIGWHDLRRAYPNISIATGAIEVKISMIDHTFRWIVTTLCSLVGGYALYVLGYAIVLYDTKNPTDFLWLTFAALILLLSVLFFSSLNWAYHSAIKLRKVTHKILEP